MTGNDSVESLGRKVFFLHPSALIQNEVIEELAQGEFEVYFSKDETKLRHLLKKYPESIVFANISDGMKENAWEEWIKSIMMEIPGVDIGIITYSDDTSLRHKYMELLKVRCGFTAMRADLPSVIKQLESILNSVNAKGRRKYVRVLTDRETNTTVNLPMNGTFVTGVIKDISTVGFSCYFADDPELVKNSHFTDIQIRLQTQLIKAQGMVFGSRMHENEKHYVFLFTQRTLPEVHIKIRKFIHTLLQTRMDNEFRR